VGGGCAARRVGSQSSGVSHMVANVVGRPNHLYVFNRQKEINAQKIVSRFLLPGVVVRNVPTLHGQQFRLLGFNVIVILVSSDFCGPREQITSS